MPTQCFTKGKLDRQLCGLLERKFSKPGKIARACNATVEQGNKQSSIERRRVKIKLCLILSILYSWTIDFAIDERAHGRINLCDVQILSFNENFCFYF